METVPLINDNMTKITIKEIAKKTGFGIGTVSRALSSTPFLVKDQTRKTILEAAKRLGYIKDINAQALVTGSTTDIGFVIPAPIFSSPFYNDFSIKLMSGLLDELSTRNHKLRVLFLRERADFDEIITEIRALKLMGLIVCPYCENLYVVEEDLRRLDIPVVVLDKKVRGKNITSVLLDDYQGGYDGTSYLLDLGHKRIAVIRGFRKDIEARYEGYLRALRDRGVESFPEFIMRGDALEKTGYEETLKLIEADPRPTAIFALDDEMAYGALRAIGEKGLNCPGSLSVLGFDGMEISKYTYPPLSTMERPVSLMGKKAVELILNEEMRNKTKNVILGAELAARSSCRKVG